jgi:hypothetical protein
MDGGADERYRAMPLEPSAFKRRSLLSLSSRRNSTPADFANRSKSRAEYAALLGRASQVTLNPGNEKILGG